MGHRVANRTNPPVQDCNHLAVRAEDGVVNAEVTKHNRGCLLDGHSPEELVGDFSNEWHARGAVNHSLVVLTAPPTHLTLNVTVVSAHCVESDFVDVHVVKFRQCFGETAAYRIASRLIEGRVRIACGAKHHSVHILHEIEGGTVHRVIDAKYHRPCHGHRRLTKR